MPALIALNGEYKDQQVLLEPGLVVTVGRSDKNMLVLANDHLISGSHCVIAHEADKGWVVEDLQSTNGTMLNGTPFTAAQVLADQDVVTIGSTQFRFQLKSGETRNIPTADAKPAKKASGPAKEPRPANPPPPAKASKPVKTPAPAKAAKPVKTPPPKDPKASETKPEKDYDEMLEDLPAAVATPGIDEYDEMLKDLPGTATSAGSPPSTDDYYDAVLNRSDEDDEEEAHVSVSEWLNTPSSANLKWAMSSILLLFVVMMLFFTRVV